MFTAVHWHSSELCGKLFGQGIKQKAVQLRLSVKMRSVWVFQADVTESCASSDAGRTVCVPPACVGGVYCSQTALTCCDRLQIPFGYEVWDGVQAISSSDFILLFLYHSISWYFFPHLFPQLIDSSSILSTDRTILILTPRQSAVRWHLKPHGKPVWMWRVVWMTPKPGV